MGRDVSVVLITFNSAAYLPRCLDGLAAQQDVSLQLIVIDNDSRDESVDIVRRRFPAAVVIRNDSNRGFAAAANQGIRASNGELILLLNPDVFLEPSYVARVADRLTAQVQPTGSAAGKLRRARGVEIEPTSHIDSLGVRMTRSGRHFDDGQGESDRDTRARTSARSRRSTRGSSRSKCSVSPVQRRCIAAPFSMTSPSITSISTSAFSRIAKMSIWPGADASAAGAPSSFRMRSAITCAA